MTLSHGEKPIAAAVRDQAIAWFTLAQSGCMSAAEQRHLEHWRQADSEHERAWQRLASIPASLNQRADLLADPLLRQVARQSHYSDLDRRKALKVLVGFGLLGGLAWQTQRSEWVQSAMADYHTATGERRHHRLVDGTELWLNTRSAIDVRFTPEARLLLLRHGEVDILTAADPTNRPLLVSTADAYLRPLGTRFNVRRDDNVAGTLLTVTQGKVAARAREGGPEQVIEAGWQARIAAGTVWDAQPGQSANTAWVDGFLVAERMRLGDFLRELARYRPGILRCDPAITDIRLSGAYPLDDGERILAMLENSLPVRVQRLTPYWVTVLPAAAS